MSRLKIQDLLKMQENGEFDPTKWNWCVHIDSIRKDDDWIECASIYVMGSGGSDCYAHIPVFLVKNGPHSDLNENRKWALQRAINFIRANFGIPRSWILIGVG